MSAQSMAKMGEKTRKQILGSLGRRPKSPQEIAEKVEKSTGYVQSVLGEAVRLKQAEVVKDGRAKLYRLPSAPAIAGTSKRAKATGLPTMSGHAFPASH